MLWPALMPVVQLVYWLQMLAETTAEGPKALVGRVSPGKQPFGLNWLTRMHVFLTCGVVLIYLTATLASCR